MYRAEKRGGINGLVVSHSAVDMFSMTIIENSRHRDGSIYRNKAFEGHFCITNRDETRLEPMMFSEPTDCRPSWETCSMHSACAMMQIFSLKLAKIPIDNDCIQLYGYIAVRDDLDKLLNYVVNYSRDNPIIMQQGDLIEMTGPKRGISMCCSVLLEFDMRIKKGEQERDDLQLIDGAIDYIGLITATFPFTKRINGDCGAVDITLARVYWAVEATIQVIISDVQSGFNLYLSSLCFVSDVWKEIQLFNGPIGESCGLRRYVVAVSLDTWMHLKLKVGQKGSNHYVERYCSFKAINHGCSSQQILGELASISMKVTWSTLLD
uniref:DUF6598 domain-containing protein n=1 Tax=Oryza rufipogon TaxID=4529 RepID=A0A0E0QNG3_ORYRU